MRVRIVKIGNSQGIRIPKPLLEETGLSGDVEIQLDGDRLIIRAAEPPRTGWGEAFKAMADGGEDALVNGHDQRPTRWEEEEWEWS